VKKCISLVVSVSTAVLLSTSFSLQDHVTTIRVTESTRSFFITKAFYLNRNIISDR